MGGAWCSGGIARRWACSRQKLDSPPWTWQLFMLQKTKEGEAFTLLWIFCVGAYRGLYLLNWVYRYATV